MSSALQPLPAGVVKALIEDEAALLGTVVLLADEGSTDEALSHLAQLQPRFFYDERHKRLLDALNVAAKEPGGPDTLNLDKALGTGKGIKALRDYAVTLPLLVFSPLNFSAHLESVQAAAGQREALELIEDLHGRFAGGELNREHLAIALSGAATGIKSDAGDTKAPRIIRFSSPSEILAWQPPAGHFLIEGGLVTRGELCLLAGPPGVGKSRGALALAVTGATGSPWFGLQPACQWRTVIVQNENGRHRLKEDFEELARNGVDLEGWVSVSEAPDCGLAFAREDFRQAVASEILRMKAGLLIIDPWTEATAGDKREDYQDALRWIRAATPPDHPVALVIVAHTRKPQGDERHSGRALLHLIAGSYSVGASSRSAFVVQAAADDPQDARIVFTCCKANNGPMPAPSAWTRERARFSPCPDFDWEAFRGGKRTGRPAKIELADVQALFAGGRHIPRKNAAKELAEACDCDISNAYRALETWAHLIGEDSYDLLFYKPRG